MTPDFILSNPPYGKIGVDITKQLMENHNDSQMAILGRMSMFNKHYDCIALEYVQVGKYQYDPKGGKTRNMDWNVSQAILLGWHRKWSTWTEVIPRETVSACQCSIELLNHARNIPVYCSIGLPVSEQGNNGRCSSRTLPVCTECELPPIEHVKWVKEMNSNYVWELFESLEDAVNAAVYLGSWETPSDSHNRLKELGFIDTLIPHEE